MQNVLTDYIAQFKITIDLNVLYTVYEKPKYPYGKWGANTGCN